MSIEERIVANIESILDLWDITYDKSDEKYIAKTNSNVILNSEQIEWIGKIGLSIFSVQKYDETLIVRFSSGGRSS